MTLLILLILQQPTVESIDLVRQGELDIRPGQKIGETFEAYPYWIDQRWSSQALDSATKVTFHGTFSHLDAMKAIQEHQYEWELSFKFMQLNAVYELEKDGPQQQTFEVDFNVEDGRFEVVSGRLVTLHEDGEVKTYPLSDKALLTVVKAMYRPTDPYAVLIKGLPFK